MDLWFSEFHTPTVKLSIKITGQLYSGKSSFQQIDVFESEELGRFLTLDGFMMLTERDEFIYHDMIVHVPMAVNTEIKRVLVIGAGDGGTIRELCRYAGVEQVDLVEIDEMVVSVCKEFLPFTSCSFDDPRVKIHYKDGSQFVKNLENIYDLIIVDSTDPFGPGEALFTEEFYRNCHSALTGKGIMVNQHESPFYEEDRVLMQSAHEKISGIFSVSEIYQAHIPTYSSGYWLFGFASKTLAPLRDFYPEKWNALGLETKYYNTRLHTGSFALPSYVNALLKK
jgi:spermidine synthase